MYWLCFVLQRYPGLESICWVGNQSKIVTLFFFQLKGLSIKLADGVSADLPPRGGEVVEFIVQETA
ncbi:MAG: hypothetical protein B6D70_13230 [gamma proteobacterium symbiont of Stewartia floridana]|nr:MAG: hypothetical protein B6D70_13230 [gamma proteobacterium symbiont of Stewartia floridana]RLW66274.1 MAG: hypothetical protein B6D73_03510 [gamma proteobacterium symbiont of Stewartia floridana]